MRAAGRWRFGTMAMLLTVLVGLTATATAAEGPAGPLEALQGSWKTGSPDGHGLGTWTFDGTTLKVDFPAMKYVASVKVDASTEPARIDCTITEGQAEVVGETVLGLIAVEGEQATLCVAAPGSPRPTSLEPVDGVFRFDLSRKPN